MKNQTQTQSECYVSVDIETDGRIPGLHSMLSLGAVVVDSSQENPVSFYVNLLPLPGAEQHKETMLWWESQPEAWACLQTNRVEPEIGMTRFAQWINELPGQPVCVACPAGWDFGWIYWYLMKFVGNSPFRHHAIDLNSLAMALSGRPYRQAYKQFADAVLGPIDDDVAVHRTTEGAVRHNALDDAIRQGKVFAYLMEMMNVKHERT